VSAYIQKGAKVGFVGWRGMVGSVLMQRMQQESDFALIAPTFFSTSAIGGDGPVIAGKPTGKLANASTTPMTSIPNLKRRAGAAIGLTQRRLFEWQMTPLSFLIH
jgi:aspartate-semialdehyde dehydrogenase